MGFKLIRFGVGHMFIIDKPVYRLLMLACISAVLVACKAGNNNLASQASIAAAAISQVSAAPAAVSQADAPLPSVHHFLWRISRGREYLYLVGSLHALNPDDYPLPAMMEGAFRHSSTLVEEINLTTVDTQSMQQEALRMGAYSGGRSLRTELPPAVYKEVAADAGKLGIDMRRLDLLRPWLGSIAILDMQLKQAGYRASDGVDHHFADEAQMSGKRTIGLETSRFQLRLLADMPPKVQQEMLLQTLDQASDFSREMQDLTEAWKTGDTAALEKILKHEFGDYPLTYKLLISDRNREWMPQLKRMVRGRGRYFVVVGALHMVGPDGLLKRFEKDGYKVEQL